jgi:hypothetical protein
MMEEYTKSNCPLMSDDVRAFYKAFIPARLKMESAIKASKGNFGKYADINSIYDACVAPLGESGIAVYHGVERLEDGSELLRTRLVHCESGQWIGDNRILILDKPGNQGRGGASTYARKEAIKALCALGCEDDDCDSEAEPRNCQKQEQVISAKEIEALEAVINKCANPVKIKNNILGFNKVGSLAQLPISKFDSVVSYIAKNSGLQ